jgi:hypothetical protein
MASNEERLAQAQGYSTVVEGESLVEVLEGAGSRMAVRL